jgi:hypothetical protein
MRLIPIFLLLGAITVPAIAQKASDPVVLVEYTHPAQSPTHWTLILHPDGSAHFSSEKGNAPVQDVERANLPNLNLDLQLSVHFTDHVFQVARRHHLFQEKCESGLKVAFTGWKKLSYRGAEGEGSCTFNYGKDKEIEELGGSLTAAALTILSGARLELLLQHDRLGLDAELESLAEAAADGNATQFCAIRKILDELVDDPRVMERAKKRARALLAKAEQE